MLSCSSSPFILLWSGTNGSLEVWHRTGSNPFEKKVDAVGIPTMQVQGGVPSTTT